MPTVWKPWRSWRRLPSRNPRHRRSLISIAPGSRLTITALCELRPLPEHADAIIQLAIEQVSLPASSVAGRRVARLYQHVDDPAWLLYLGEWDSRAAFDAYRATAPQPGRLDQHRQPPTCRVFRRLALFERILTPVGLACADIVTGPPASSATRRAGERCDHLMDRPCT